MQWSSVPVHWEIELVQRGIVPVQWVAGPAWTVSGTSTTRRRFSGITTSIWCVAIAGFSWRRLVYDADAGHFSPAGNTERRFQQGQDIYMESTMGGEFPGEVL